MPPWPGRSDPTAAWPRHWPAHDPSASDSSAETAAALHVSPSGGRRGSQRLEPQRIRDRVQSARPGVELVGGDGCRATSEVTCDDIWTYAIKTDQLRCLGRWRWRRPSPAQRARRCAQDVVIWQIHDRRLRDLQQLLQAHAGASTSARREFDNTHHCNSVTSLDDSVCGDRMKNVDSRCRLVVNTRPPQHQHEKYTDTTGSTVDLRVSAFRLNASFFRHWYPLAIRVEPIHLLPKASSVPGPRSFW